MMPPLYFDTSSTRHAIFDFPDYLRCCFRRAYDDDDAPARGAACAYGDRHHAPVPTRCRVPQQQRLCFRAARRACVTAGAASLRDDAARQYARWREAAVLQRWRVAR